MRIEGCCTLNVMAVFIQVGINIMPCIHGFKEIEIVLGEKLYATLEARGETPKIYTVADNGEQKEFCRRMCYRVGTLSAIIVGCITKRMEAIAAAVALSELLIDCDTCCEKGFGSSNCCKDLKFVFHQVCQQHLLDGL